MELPNIKNPIRDAERDVLYVVMAYRTLSRAEVVQMVRMHQAQQKKKPARRSVITIFTSLGALES